MSLDLLDHLHGKVLSGEISADLMDLWEPKGIAYLLAAAIHTRNGKGMISFRLRNEVTKKEKEMDILLPEGPTDKHAGMKMGRIYATLFAAAGWSQADGYTPTQAMQALQAHLVTHVVKVTYEAPVKSVWSEKKNKDMENQYLESFTRIASQPRTTPAQAAPQQAPAQQFGQGYQPQPAVAQVAAQPQTSAANFGQFGQPAANPQGQGGGFFS